MTQTVENIEIIVEDACKNPIMLRWKNLLGGWDQWLFKFNQISTLNTNQGEIYQQNFTNLETTTCILQVLQKEGRKRLLLTAENITLDQVKNIRLIGVSPHVEMLIDYSSSPALWQTVIVQDRDIGTYQTQNERHTLQLSINLMELQTQSN